MKRITLFATTVLFSLCSVNAQLSMESDGDVIIGSGSSTSYQLQINGQMAITHTPTATSGLYFTNYSSYPVIKPQWDNRAYLGLSSFRFKYVHTKYLYYDIMVDWSDINIKENVRSIKNPLASICQIRAIQYDLKREHYSNSREDEIDELVESSKNKYGVIAQELKEILPDLVIFNDEAELYAVNYVGMIPILIEAIKEQQLLIEELQSSIKLLDSNSLLKAASISTSSDDHNLDSYKTGLFQNSPNPFTEKTTIKYNLSADVKSATIYIYDMSGKQLRGFKLHHKGSGDITIHGGELDAGMYMYTLITDGRIIGTKQMILTK